MKSLFLTLVLIVAVTPNLEAHKNQPHADKLMGGEGHGGDPIRKLFNEAKKAAVKKLKKLTPCSFAEGDDEATIRWILEYREKLAENIEQSNHVWNNEIQSTCALVFPESKVDISLSFKVCRDSLKGDGKEDALWLLLHEATHNFNIKTEPQSDRIASMIMEATENTNETCIKRDQIANDFKSCSGRPIQYDEIETFFPKGRDMSLIVGKYTVDQRHRECNKGSGCAPWDDKRAPVFYTQKNTVLGATNFKEKRFMGFHFNDFFKISRSESTYKSYDINILIDHDYISTCSFTQGSTFCENLLNLYVDKNYAAKIGFLDFGHVTNNCFRFAHRYSTLPNGNGNFSETETVFRGDFIK